MIVVENAQDRKSPGARREITFKQEIEMKGGRYYLQKMLKNAKTRQKRRTEKVYT